LLLVDLRAMRFETLTYGWDENNPLSGQGAPGALTA
jgi:molybdopterin-synthase adenylyltransferase